MFAYTPERHEREQLGFRTELAGRVLRVRVTSPAGCVRLNKTNIDPLKIHVRDALDAGAITFVLNLRDCLEIDSYAMGTLYAMRNEFWRLCAGDVVIEDADADIRSLFDHYHVAYAFTFSPSQVTL